MRLLLDTRVLIWAVAEPGRLPPAVRDVLADGTNVVAVSAASAWEIAIKRANGRLRFPTVDAAMLARAGYEALPIAIHHAAAVKSLPDHHGDQFDRMLVAQAQADDYRLVTRDPAIHRYEVDCFWGNVGNA